MTSAVMPGINSHFIFKEDYTDEECKIIQTVSREWQVTSSGDPVRLSNSTYRFFLAKPARNFQEMFNIDREIVFVFSPYSDIEPRTLDAIDNAIRLFQALRLERICAVVISKDADVQTKLRELLKSNQESRIVVPFVYDELLSPNSNPYFMRNRFKEHFYTRDLFAFQSPLRTDIYFFGRTDLVHEIASRHRSNESSGIFGLRKTGKTSLIYGIMRALAQDESHAVLVDCQNPAFHQRRWNEALYYLLNEIRSQLGLNILSLEEKLFTETDAPILFERELVKIHGKFQQKSLLLIFDEIENITFQVSPSEHWRNGRDFVYFWQTLRSLFQEHSQVFTYLVVGTNPTCVESPSANGFDNPIFNQIPFQYIPGFDVPQTREMVRKLGKTMGITFDEILYGKLTEDFGGHPFLIRQVCSIINKLLDPERPSSVGKAIYEQAKAKFSQEYQNYIEMILSVLRQYYPDEYAMLEYLAVNDTKTFKEFASLSPEYTNHLLGYGLIEQVNGLYGFKIESVKQHLAHKGRFKKLNPTPKEMLAEISERRNELEL
ncbi:MAG: hypothetical protein U0822_23070 [Anaerolineae bacterium]